MPINNWYDRTGRQSVSAHQGPHGHARAASNDVARWGTAFLRAGKTGIGEEGFRGELQPDLARAADFAGAELLAQARCAAGFVREIGGALQLRLSQTDRGECPA